jgi:hypothetical protein
MRPVCCMDVILSPSLRSRAGSAKDRVGGASEPWSVTRMRRPILRFAQDDHMRYFPSFPSIPPMSSITDPS